MCYLAYTALGFCVLTSPIPHAYNHGELCASSHNVLQCYILTPLYFCLLHLVYYPDFYFTVHNETWIIFSMDIQSFHLLDCSLSTLIRNDISTKFSYNHESFPDILAYSCIQTLLFFYCEISNTHKRTMNKNILQFNELYKLSGI